MATLHLYPISIDIEYGHTMIKMIQRSNLFLTRRWGLYDGTWPNLGTTSALESEFAYSLDGTEPTLPTDETRYI